MANGKLIFQHERNYTYTYKPPFIYLGEVLHIFNIISYVLDNITFGQAQAEFMTLSQEVDQIVENTESGM